MFKLFRFIKDLFRSKDSLKEETRTLEFSSDESSRTKIDNENPIKIIPGLYGEAANAFIAYLLEDAINDGELKPYKNVNKFIKAHRVELNYDPTLEYNVELTSEFEKLKMTWAMLGYKCTSERLNTLMSA